MSKRLSRSDGLSPEEGHKTEKKKKKTAKKKSESKVYETKPCRRLTLPPAPQGLFQAASKSPGP